MRLHKGQHVPFMASTLPVSDTNGSVVFPGLVTLVALVGVSLS